MRKDIYYLLDNSGSIDSNNRPAALNSAMNELVKNIDNLFSMYDMMDVTVTYTRLRMSAMKMF